jgi:hypothetical protein
VELLLAAGAGPDPAQLAARVGWWRDRERDLVRNGGPDVEPPGLVIPAAEHARCEAWLPVDVVRRDVHTALRAHFAEPLDALGVDLRTLALARSRSWLDARARVPLLARQLVPSTLLESLADACAAHDLLFALAAPPRAGSTLGRYAAELDGLVLALGPRLAVDVRPSAWDVGCATGEGTWELARALLAARPAAGGVDVIGTTPCPLERLLAERRARPHDPPRAAALEALAAGLGPRARVRFERGDVRDGPPRGGPFDAITCHGLLGEGLDGEADVKRAVAVLADALAPGGLLSVADRFRADRRERARALVRAAAAGLTEVGAGLYRR